EPHRRAVFREPGRPRPGTSSLFGGTLSDAPGDTNPMMHKSYALLLTSLAGSLLACACSPSAGGSGAGGTSGSVASSGAGGAAPSSGSGMQASSSATSSASSSGSGGTGGAASSGSSSSGSGGGPLTFTGFCNGMKTSLTGKALAPNGIDPLPNVRVYA